MRVVINDQVFYMPIEKAALLITYKKLIFISKYFPIIVKLLKTQKWHPEILRKFENFPDMVVRLYEKLPSSPYDNNLDVSKIEDYDEELFNDVTKAIPLFPLRVKLYVYDIIRRVYNND